jgi:hypothetical protein
MDVSGHMHVNGTVRASNPLTHLGVSMPSMKSLVTTAAIALAVVVGYEKYGKKA